ncbi:MAG TPA: hypothetical protein PLE32_11015, partial [Haliscomenobacter sp.]|nr:hypothetical protein [Haliscomenobacter sp.]
MLRIPATHHLDLRRSDLHFPQFFPSEFDRSIFAFLTVEIDHDGFRSILGVSLLVFRRLSRFY